MFEEKGLFLQKLVRIFIICRGYNFYVINLVCVVGTHGKRMFLKSMVFRARFPPFSTLGKTLCSLSNVKGRAGLTVDTVNNRGFHGKWNTILIRKHICNSHARLEYNTGIYSVAEFLNKTDNLFFSYGLN